MRGQQHSCADGLHDVTKLRTLADMIQEQPEPKIHRIMLNLSADLAARLEAAAELTALRPSQVARLILAERLRGRGKTHERYASGEAVSEAAE